MNWRRRLLTMLAAGGILTAAQAETGYVHGDTDEGKHAEVQFEGDAASSYVLNAETTNGWVFTEDFSYSNSNGWYSDAKYQIKCEKIEGVITEFVDATQCFSASMSGTMYKPSEEEGSLVGWSVSGKGYIDIIPLILPADAIIPVGSGGSFTYYIGNEFDSDSKTEAPGGLWRYSQISSDTGGKQKPQWEKKGASFRFPKETLAGIYSLEAARNSQGAFQADAYVKIVEVASITVDGATQKNVIGEENWVTIKGAGDVIIKVTLNPAVYPYEYPADLVTWSGGEEVKEEPLQRKVSKSKSQKVTVKATCGTSVKEINIWIVNATVNIQTSREKPIEAASLKFAYNDPFCGTTIDEAGGLDMAICAEQ